MFYTDKRTGNTPVNVYERMYSSALKLLYPYTPERTYMTVVKEAMKLVGAKYGTLYLVMNNTIERVYTSNKILNDITPRKRGNTWKAIMAQTPYMYDAAKGRKLHPEVYKLHIGSDIGVPIAFNDKSFALLSVLSPPGKPFTNNDLFTLQMFSPFASLALRNTFLYSEVLRSLNHQDLFISMAAHELKTPLTAITIYAQMLQQEQKQYQNIHIKEKLINEIERLSKLVNELLQVSQIRKGRLQYVMKKCDLQSIVEQTVSNFQAGHKDHKIVLRNNVMQKECFIKGDKNKMIQVITNLLTNAVKFSKSKTTITVSITITDANICITVKDMGIGMTPDQTKRIFEGFYKGSPLGKEGLGLGLFLVKSIVMHHRGKVEVESIPQKGSTFRVFIPCYMRK